MFFEAKLPEKFRMLDLDKFEETEDPNVHLRMYVRALSPMGIRRELLGHLVQRTLTRVALCLFLNLDPTKIRTWEDIFNVFVYQYVYNTQLDVTTKEPKTSCQDAKAMFSTFLERWRAKAIKMTTSPTMKD